MPRVQRPVGRVVRGLAAEEGSAEARRAVLAHLHPVLFLVVQQVVLQQPLIFVPGGRGWRCHVSLPDDRPNDVPAWLPPTMTDCSRRHTVPSAGM